MNDKIFFDTEVRLNTYFLLHIENIGHIGYMHCIQSMCPMFSMCNKNPYYQ